MTFNDINEEMGRLTAEIGRISHDLNAAREEYLTKKAVYDNVHARNLMEVKLKNPDFTQTDVKAQATALSFNERMDLIRADSAYHKLLNDLRAVRERVEVLREISFNLRKEASL